MFRVLLLCGCFVWANGYLKEVDLPVFSPPSQDVIVSKYFRNRARESERFNRNKKSIANDSEKFHKAVEFMKNDLSANISSLRKEMFGKNVIDVGKRKNISGLGKVTRLAPVKPSISSFPETTTYKYPTATYNVEKYEKYKASRINRLVKILNKPYPVSSPPITNYQSFDLPKRGRVKWKDTRGKTSWDADFSDSNQSDYNKLRVDRSDGFVDRFLEEALTRYLVSSNLTDHVGNVSVKTFTEILKNITQPKPATKKFSRHDKDSESRIKFKDESYSNRNKVLEMLEKQRQRRLERMKSASDTSTSKDTSKENVFASPWKYSQIRRIGEASTEEIDKNGKVVTTEGTTTVTESTTTEAPSTVFTYAPTTDRSNIYGSSSAFETTTDAKIKEVMTNSIIENPPASKNQSEIKLSVAETVYYTRQHFPVRSLIIEQDKSGVIPGIPEVDYPMYSVPPATGFKCPNVKGGRPRMMADAEARCQVFYICTGDGPAAAMLCPNGTMFNENVLVCDWWYNVDC